MLVKSIVIISLILIVLCLAISQRKVQEHFTSNKIDKQVVSQVYQNTGIERCESLYADIASKGDMRGQMTDRAVETMDNYILGHRLREWIPMDAKKQQEQASSGSKHCYMMYDDNHNVIDPILKNEKCDMTNTIFAGIDFIEKVYIDSNLDLTHTLPYNKCVLQINPNKVETTSMNYFWSRMGDAQCTQYKNTASNEIKGLVNDVSRYNEELKVFKTLEPQYTKCMKDQQILNNNIKHVNYLYSLSNCAFTGECANVPVGSSVSMKTDYNNLQQTLKLKQEKMKSVSNDIKKTQKLLKENERKYNEENLVFYGLSNAAIRCSNVDLPEKKRALGELSDEYGRLYTTSNLVGQQLDTCKREFTNKTNEYSLLTSTINKLKSEWAGSNSLHVTCLSTNDYLRANVATLKDQVQTASTQCNVCMGDVVMKTAERDSLLRDVASLSNERDEWLRRCKFDQKSMLDLSISTINSLRAASSTYTRQNCGNDMKEAEEVNDLIQKKFKALAQLSGPPGCDEARRLECCGARGYE